MKTTCAVDRILESDYDVANKAYQDYVRAREMGRRCPGSEPTIAKDPESSYYYARDVIKGRWPEAEDAIVTVPHYKDAYLKQFPDAKDDWAMNGWIDWLD
jgi:hypothetical protein